MTKLVKFLIFIIAITALLIVIFINQFGLTLIDMPSPTGQFSVGNVKLHWQNVNSEVDSKYKEFNVDVFYPTKKTDLKKYDYHSKKMKAIASEVSKDSILPKFVWEKLLSNIHTYTKHNAEIIKTEAKFPIIIYLPGINSEDLHNLYLEELASHGYVIFAIEPPYDITATVLTNGEIITVDPYLKKIVKENNRDEIYKYRNKAHERWEQYIESAIKNIKDLNSDKMSMFYQKLDIDEIGLLGHSHGGAVALDFCQRNKICKAGIDMDGWTKTYNKGSIFENPFLFMLSETDEMPEMKDLLENNKNNPNFKKLIIEGADHGSFTDYIIAKKPFIISNNSEKIKLRKYISETIASFFDNNLKK